MMNKLVFSAMLLISFNAFSGNEGGNGGHPTELMWLSSFSVLEESFEKLYESQEELIYKDENGRQQGFTLPQSHLNYLLSYNDFVVDASTSYQSLKVSKKDFSIQIPINAFESYRSKHERVCFVMKSLFHKNLTNLQLPPCSVLQTQFSERPKISKVSDVEDACKSMESASQLPVYSCFLESEIQSSMIQAQQSQKNRNKRDSLDNAYVKTTKVQARNGIEAILNASILLEEDACKRASTEPQIIYSIWANSFYVSCAREFAK